MVITATSAVPVGDFERATGWEVKPEGACRGGVCIPLPGVTDVVDLHELEARVGMPLIHDEDAGLWALGPAPGPALADAVAPDFTLPDWRGREFTLSSLRGRKVAVVAWAPW